MGAWVHSDLWLHRRTPHTTPSFYPSQPTESSARMADVNYHCFFQTCFFCPGNFFLGQKSFPPSRPNTDDDDDGRLTQYSCWFFPFGTGPYQHLLVILNAKRFPFFDKNHVPPPNPSSSVTLVHSLAPMEIFFWLPILNRSYSTPWTPNPPVTPTVTSLDPQTTISWLSNH